MSAISLAKSNKNNNVIIGRRMKDYGKDPFFKKMAENALAFIKKLGLPGSAKKRDKYPVIYINS